MSDLIRTELQDHVLNVVLTRPEKRNALNPELFDALGDAFDQAADPQVRVVLLEGEGPVFCAGIDLMALSGLGSGPSDGSDNAGKRWQSNFMRLEEIGVPAVAAVQGAAVGAGLQLALACDLRVVAEDVRLGLLEINYGIIPDLGGIHRVVAACGVSRAKDLILSGRELGATEALAWGLVDRVVPAADVAGAARELANQIASRAPRATRAGKRIADRAAAGDSPAENLERVLEAQIDLLQHPHFLEAVSARMQGRQPDFQD